MQLKINDYSFNSMVARTGFAKVEIFGRKVEFIFSDEDAVVAGIELGLIEQPDDSDHTRIGYAKPYFSATVYDNVGFEKGIQYTGNQTVLADYEATEYGEQIVTRLALQSSEVREVIQAEAERIALHECPASIVEVDEIVDFILYNTSHKDLYYSTLNGNVDWIKISNHKKELWYAAEQETLSQL